MSNIENSIWVEIHRIEAAAGERLSWCGNAMETVDGATSRKRYAAAPSKRGVLRQLKAVA